MGTRLYCDQCGNTVQKFNVVEFGQAHPKEVIAQYESDKRAYEAYCEKRAQQMRYDSDPFKSMMAQASQGSMPRAPTLPQYSKTQVELCDHCLPIWLERVKNLTKASDVE